MAADAPPPARQRELDPVSSPVDLPVRLQLYAMSVGMPIPH